MGSLAVFVIGSTRQCLERSEEAGENIQEKQVLDCVMIENANSAVSSIFDATDDCNMGQFLQLGLPSGCSSQCPVQNNAEPLNNSQERSGPSRPGQLSLGKPSMICPQQQDLPIAFPDSQPFKPTARRSDVTVTYIDHDNSAVSPTSDDATDCNMGQFLQLGLPSGCSLQSSVHNNTEPSDGTCASLAHTLCQ
ncbi:putative disease resistance protein RGA4 [Cocos nucifera]|nr:putative disease resistance protein RGA4 [Cocos nucifera]